MNEVGKQLGKAADTILAGGTVIIATETFYCIAADPFNELAVQRIFQIKSRLYSRPLPLIASDAIALKRLSPVLSPLALKLMDQYWPGSLTILLKSEVHLSDLLTSKMGKIGVRVPPDCAAKSLASMVGGLITATSANLSGEQNPAYAEMISPKVISAVDLVVDTGPTPGGSPSTVVDIHNEDVQVIRDGAIPKDKIEMFLRQKAS
jgi:L-threonylcarbamoyladenylate synthase